MVDLVVRPDEFEGLALGEGILTIGGIVVVLVFVGALAADDFFMQIRNLVESECRCDASQPAALGSLP